MVMVPPIGLTVVQDYRELDKPHKIDTFWGDLDLYSSERGSKINTDASKRGSSLILFTAVTQVI